MLPRMPCFRSCVPRRCRIHIELANAQPSTGITKWFKIAVKGRPCKDRVILHLPNSCPVKQLLQTMTKYLFVPKPEKLLFAP